MAPLTPARPKKGGKQTANSNIPATNTFASRQIQGSPNKRAATVLFTPCQQHTAHLSFQTQSSPTQHAVPASHLVHVMQPSESGVEGKVAAELEALNLQPHSSGSPFSSAFQSHSGSKSRSGSHSPRAGPHSKQKRVILRPKAGAKDIWTFFQKSHSQHTCLLCQ